MTLNQRKQEQRVVIFADVVSLSSVTGCGVTWKTIKTTALREKQTTVYFFVYSRLRHECPPTLRDQRSQSVWPRSHREEGQDPLDHQGRVRGRVCHRWEDTGLRSPLWLIVMLIGVTVHRLYLQCAKLATWCPWIQTVCRTPTSNSNWFRILKATASRRPRPSAPHLTPCGTRVLLCESFAVVTGSKECCLKHSILTPNPPHHQSLSCSLDFPFNNILE